MLIKTVKVRIFENLNVRVGSLVIKKLMYLTDIFNFCKINCHFKFQLLYVHNTCHNGYSVLTDFKACSETFST